MCKHDKGHIFWDIINPIKHAEYTIVHVKGRGPGWLSAIVSIRQGKYTI